jgi:hypothetical protein
VTVTDVLAVIVPLVPLTVTVYVPTGVPGEPGGVLDDPPPPHPIAPAPPSSNSRAAIAGQPRLLGSHNSTTQPSATPAPRANQRSSGIRFAAVPAVVETDSTAVTGPVPVTATLDGTLQLGATPPLAADTEQLSETVPVKPFAGESVSVPVPPWPGAAMVMPLVGPARVNEGVGALTFTVIAPVDAR